ncbi:MAG: hypothetical protein GY801_51650 [bacterium]|nr:hypothetical protein [bacterium]
MAYDHERHIIGVLLTAPFQQIVQNRIPAAGHYLQFGMGGDNLRQSTPMKLTDIMVSFLLMAAADFSLLRRSYETDLLLWSISS